MPAGRSAGLLQPVREQAPLWGLTAALCAIAAGLQLTLPQFPAAVLHGSRISFWLLAALVVVAEMLVIHLQLGRQTQSFSLGEVPLVIGLVFAGPLVLVAARVAGAAATLALHRRQPPLKLAFNVAQVWLCTLVAVRLWHVLQPEGHTQDPRGWLAVIAVVAVGDAVAALVVGLAMRLAGTRQPRGEGVRQLLAGGAAAVTNASFGIVAVTVLASDWRLGWSLVAVSAGLYAGYRSYSSLERRTASLEHISAFTQAVGSELRAEAVTRAILVHVRELLGCAIAELTLPPHGDAPGLRLLLGPGEQRSLSPLDDRGPTAVFRALLDAQGGGGAGRQGLLAPRGTRDDSLQAALAHAGLQDAVLVRLQGLSGGQGMLLVGNRQSDVETFTADDLALLGTLANHATVALANGRLTDRLRREAAEREHEALHDQLTALPNRRFFQQEAQRRLAEGQEVAVILLDLDRFKEINDTLGHHTGDEVLRVVGERIALAVPAGGLLARLGGDEYGILLTDVTPAEAFRVAMAVREELGEPVRLQQLPLHVDASAGIAVSPADGRDAQTLLQRADVAMYAAKGQHTGVERYSAADDQHSRRRLALVGDLRDVLATRTDLALHYQPKVELATGRVTGVEALLRWHHPRYGLLPPDEFIPLAEPTGLMRMLTLEVMETALRQCRSWKDEGLSIGVAVNLAPRSLLDPGLPADVAKLLAVTGVDAADLTLEVTESTLADPVQAVAMLARLQAMGVRLSVDDFGTGYSSLSYLKRLPVHEIKIDRAFVMHMSSDPDSAAIVAATVELARRLGKQVVAEGVEDAQAMAALRTLGCTSAQGYHISRPVPAADLTAWLRNRGERATVRDSA